MFNWFLFIQQLLEDGVSLADSKLVECLAVRNARRMDVLMSVTPPVNHLFEQSWLFLCQINLRRDFNACLMFEFVPLLAIEVSRQVNEWTKGEVVKCFDIKLSNIHILVCVFCLPAHPCNHGRIVTAERLVRTIDIKSVPFGSVLTELIESVVAGAATC